MLLDIAVEDDGMLYEGGISMLLDMDIDIDVLDTIAVLEVDPSQVPNIGSQLPGAQ